LAVEPERRVGGVVDRGDRLTCRQDHRERRPALARDVDGVKAGRHKLDRVADVDRRPVREEVVDVSEGLLEGLLLRDRQPHVDCFCCRARARRKCEYGDRGGKSRLSPE
jgi:hypothetical protein